MSDRSSESSGEWIVLNEDEEALTLDNNEQSLSLELSYDAISYAVSDSIRSSISSEELEWQYEQYDNYIPPHRPSFIQEVDFQGFSTDDHESENSNAEDDVVNNCVSTSGIGDNSLDMEFISKVHIYKHKRNDDLNSVLNFTLALVLASAVGLGFGHFLGWSHKCFKSASAIQKAADNSFELPHAVIVEQKKEVTGHSIKDKDVPLFSENILDSVSCTSVKGEDSSAHNGICSPFLNSNIAINSGVTKTPMLMNSNVLKIEVQEEISQNVSNPYALSVIPASDSLQNFDLNLLSDTGSTLKNIYGLKEVSSDNIDIDSVIDKEVNSIDFELFLKNIKVTVSDENDVAYNSEIPFYVDENNNFSFEKELDDNEFEFLKEYFHEGKISYQQNNLTNQLRKDLNEVVQSLSVIALARLSDVGEKPSSTIGKSESVIKLFNDFQTLINTRITDIDNFVSSIEYKSAPKFSLKYLQKMVYTLVDSVDYLMKISFKTLSKDGRKINVLKFFNNISKIIFNFNKKWEKNNRLWSESLRKFKVKKFQEGYTKKAKENKYWKNKAQFEKKNNYRRYSVKS